MEPLPSFDSSSSLNINLSRLISFTRLDDEGNTIPLGTDVDHPFEIVTPHDPSLILSPMSRVNVIGQQRSHFYSISIVSHRVFRFSRYSSLTEQLDRATALNNAQQQVKQTLISLFFRRVFLPISRTTDRFFTEFSVDRRTCALHRGIHWNESSTRDESFSKSMPFHRRRSTFRSARVRHGPRSTRFGGVFWITIVFRIAVPSPSSLSLSFLCSRCSSLFVIEAFVWKTSIRIFFLKIVKETQSSDEQIFFFFFYLLDSKRFSDLFEESRLERKEKQRSPFSDDQLNSLIVSFVARPMEECSKEKSIDGENGINAQKIPTIIDNTRLRTDEEFYPNESWNKKSK